MLTYKLAGQDISFLIDSVFETEEEIQENITVGEFTLTGFNEKNVFSTDHPNSIFGNDSYRNFPFEILLDGDIVFTGKINNVEIDYQSNIATMDVRNGLSEIFDKKIEYAAPLSDEMTPADIFEDILDLEGLKSKIHPSINLVKSIMRNTISGASVFMGAQFLFEDNKTVGDALNEVARAGFCEFYFSKGLFYLWHPLGTVFDSHGYVLEPFELTNQFNVNDNYDKIYNNYEITLTDNLKLSDKDFSNLGFDSRRKYKITDYQLSLKSSDPLFVLDDSTTIQGLVDLADNWLRYRRNPVKEISTEILGQKGVNLALGDQLKINLSPYDEYILRVMSLRFDNQRNVYSTVMRKVN